MRQIDHPNIVRLVDFSESRQYYYIVLELCPGGELFHQIVRLTYFSEELSRHVIVQVAKALEYLHEDKGVVHRYESISLSFSGRANQGIVISNPRICSSIPFHSFPQETQSRGLPRMKTRQMRGSSFLVLEQVVLVRSRLRTLVCRR